MLRRLASLRIVALVLVLGTSLGLGAGCRTGRPPEMHVLGVQQEQLRHREVVVVQVTNPADRPMRITKLAYRFAAAGGATLAQGEVAVGREIPAGAAVVVEVPLDSRAALDEDEVTMWGQLTAELDQIVRIFKVSAAMRVDTPGN